jgi:hypothetical protein
MTPQERDVIAGIFDRLKQVAHQPRDPEAEKFIAERVAQQPYAAYALAQSVHVQEHALMNLQQQVEQLQAQVQQLQSQPQGGGFLSSLFGGAKPQATPQPMQRPMGAPGQPMGAPGMGMAPQAGMGMQPGMQQAGPWGGQRPAGGGFLAGAMATAAGVAGGMILGNVLMNAFSGDQAGGGEQAASASGGEAAPAADAGGAAYEPASYDDGGFDGGGDSGDWA